MFVFKQLFMFLKRAVPLRSITFVRLSIGIDRQLHNMHRHLSNTDCLTVRRLHVLFASLVLLMAAAKKKPWKTGASTGHITNLKQSILETFDIYDNTYRKCNEHRYFT
jgi:hypothetical protein